MSNYKKGDLVQVIDGSWSLAIENGEFRSSCGIELGRRDFEVIGTDLKLPSTDDDQLNTIIIKAKDNNQIVYTQERFIKPIAKKAENITYNISLVINEDVDIEKFVEELHRKMKLISLQM